MKKAYLLVLMLMLTALFTAVSCSDDEETDCTVIDNQMDCEADGACL